MGAFRLALPARGKIEKGSINYLRRGAGPKLLLIHGFPLSSWMWKYQLEELEKIVELIVPDLRGFGHSTHQPESWTVADFAQDLEWLLRSQQMENVIVCGLSLGGYIAFELMNGCPDLIAGLVLCNTRATSDDEVTARGRQMMAERVQREGTGFIKETMLPKLVATENQQESVAKGVALFFDNLDPNSIIRTQLAMSHRADSTSRLGQIACPTLVVAGESDVITPASEMKEMASRIPQAEFEVIRGAGHLTPMENPSEFNSSVQRFCSRFSTPSSS